MNKKSNTFISLLAVILAVAALVGVFAAVLPSEEDLDALRPGDQIETSPDNATDIDTETEYVPNLDERGVDLNKWEYTDWDYQWYFEENQTYRFIFTSPNPEEEPWNTDVVSFLGIVDHNGDSVVTIYEESEGYGTFDRTFTFDPKIWGGGTWVDAQNNGYQFPNPYIYEMYVYVLRPDVTLPA